MKQQIRKMWRWGYSLRIGEKKKLMFLNNDSSIKIAINEIFMLKSKQISGILRTDNWMTDWVIWMNDWFNYLHNPVLVALIVWCQQLDTIGANNQEEGKARWTAMNGTMLLWKFLTLSQLFFIILIPFNANIFV